MSSEESGYIQIAESVNNKQMKNKTEGRIPHLPHLTETSSMKPSETTHLGFVCLLPSQTFKTLP